MSEFNLNGAEYQNLVKEVADVVEELLKNGAQESAAHGAVEFYDREASAQMTSEQLSRFSGNVAWRGAAAVIVDHSAEPTEAYKFLGSQENTKAHAQGLAEYGKYLNLHSEVSDRSHPVLRMASIAFAEAWNSMKDARLKDRVEFFRDEYMRVARLQDEANDEEGEQQTSSSIVDTAEALFSEAKEAEDEELTRCMNDALRELAGSLEGGIENPRAQHLLRITNTEIIGMDFLERRKLEDTADTLLKCGMIDAAFTVYGLTSSFDADKVRMNMQKRGDKSDEEIENHIRLVTGSFPGRPWDAILGLQQLPDTEEYVAQILSKIISDYPTTYEAYSRFQFMYDNSGIKVLINVDGYEEIATIIRASYKESNQHGSDHIAVRVAAMLAAEGKDDLYKKICTATADIPRALEALAEGYNFIKNQSDE